MSPVCSFCGKSYPRRRASCPHCGSDRETGWKDEDATIDLDLAGELEEEEYEALLQEEGLQPRRPRPIVAWGVLLALLAMAAITGIVWLLL